MTNHTRIDATQFLSTNYDSFSHAVRELVRPMNIGDSITIPSDHWLAAKNNSNRTFNSVRKGECSRNHTTLKIAGRVSKMCSTGQISNAFSCMVLLNGDVRIERVESLPYRMNWKSYFKAFSADGRQGSVKVSDADLEFFNFDEEKFLQYFVTNFIKKYGHSDIHLSKESSGLYVKTGRGDRVSRASDCIKLSEIAFSKLSKDIGKSIEMTDEESTVPGLWAVMRKMAKARGLKLVQSKRFKMWKLQSV